MLKGQCKAIRVHISCHVSFKLGQHLKLKDLHLFAIIFSPALRAGQTGHFSTGQLQWVVQYA